MGQVVGEGQMACLEICSYFLTSFLQRSCIKIPVGAKTEEGQLGGKFRVHANFGVSGTVPDEFTLSGLLALV